MPHREYVLRPQRIAILQMLVDMMLEVREDALGATELSRGDDDTTVLVYVAVSISHGEGKPMNATKLANFTHTPRTTVLRKLDRLIELGVVRKDGHNYLLTRQRANRLTEGRVERYRKIIMRGLKALYDSGERVNFAPRPKSPSVTDTQKA